MLINLLDPAGLGSQELTDMASPRVYYRRYPSGRFISADVCRSTWVLVNGLWNRIQTEVSPLQQAERFDQ